MFKKRYFAILFFVILGSAIAAFYYLNNWINHSLPEILNSNSNRTYDIRYEVMDYDWMSNSMHISDIHVKPLKESDTEAILSGLIERLEINVVSITSLLFDKKVKAESIQIIRPEFKIISKDKKHKASNDSKSLSLFWKDMYNSIEIKDVILKHGSIQVKDDESLPPNLSSKDISISLSGVRIDTLQVTNPLPFAYDDFKLYVGASNLKVSKLYEVEVSNLEATNSGLQINDFKVVPLVSRSEFTRVVDFEKDLVSCETGSMHLQNTNWGFYNDTLQIKATKLDIDKLDLYLYRNKQIRDGKQVKKLYSQILRELSFYITIDSLDVKNGKVVYEEQKKLKGELGKLNFNNVFISGTNLNNFHYKDNQDLTQINFVSKLYKSAKLEAQLAFHVKDLNDTYQAVGSLSGFDVSEVDSYIKPLMDITASGNVYSLDFSINGSRRDANASIVVDYEDLKIVILNKKTKKRSFFKTKAANLLIKSNKQRKKVVEHVYLKRDESKSMYYQMWKCIQSALKEIII